MKNLLSKFSGKNKIPGALHEKEDLICHITENVKGMLYRMSVPEGIYQYVSSASTEITGYSPDEYYSNPFLLKKIIHPDWCDYFDQQWNNLLKGEILPSCEFQILHKSGEVRWINQKNILIPDNKGHPVSIEGIITDISGQKRLEVELSESRAGLNAIFENAADGILIADRERKKFVMCNRMICQMLGYTQDEILALGVMEIHPEEDLPYVIDQFDRQARKEYTLAKNIPVKRKDGSCFYADINSFTIVLEGKECLVGFFRDVTDRKQTEEALQESEKRVRNKLKAILSPDSDISTLELSDIIDTEMVQKLMEDFFRLTNIGIGIIDLKGKVIVGTGWQGICTRFHRKNEESCLLCIESDLELSSNVQPGTFKQYKCKNNMWDIATPVMLGDRHLGNIFLGQFLYEDEAPDYEIFRQQARRYGFIEHDYLEALDRVPRWNKKTVDSVMSFYSAFAVMIGNLSYSNIKLASALEERKKTEEKLNRLNRELHAIRSCNQTLLRADDEQILLNEICHIICDEAGYLLAWVGYAENDPAKTIRPVAWAGLDSGYIENARLSWADNLERGKGPAGIAVRRGETVIVQDIATDSRMGPWQESSLERGYHSGLALPLKDKNSNVFGVLLIYSGEMESLSNDEISLMEELAGDLTYGIIALRARSEHLKAVELLKNSEERFSKVFRQSPIAIAISKESDNCFIDVNNIFVNETGYSRDEILGKPPSELGLFADPEDGGRILSALKEKGFIKNFEIKTRLKSGAIRIGLNTTIRIILNEEPHYLSLIQDITEKKQAEIELRKLSRAVEQSPVSIVITDVHGNIEYINSKFSEVTGYTQSEVLGQNPRILKSGEMSADNYKILWQTITSGKEWYGEFHNRKKNGELFWELASISPIFDSSGAITHFLGIKEDITLRKQYEYDLIEAKEKAEESDRLKTAFLHNISHEIRTPLNAIVGFSTLLGEPNLDAEDRQSHIDLISQSSDQLCAIVSEIVEISNIEAGIVKFNESEINLNVLFQKLLKQFIPEADKKGIVLEISSTLSEIEARIISDNTKLNQILLNLINNALKFTERGHIEFGCSLKGDYLEFNVSDTGIGIPEEHKTKIFNRFYQVDNGPSRLFGGTGLGLSICKAYIEHLGGAIWLTSEPDKGTTFIFNLPYRKYEPEVKPKPGSYLYNNNLIISPVTVLVAEDNNVNFKLIDYYLQETGIKVIRATNGKEALEYCKLLKETDIVLMDLKMPELDGCAATKLIKDYNPNLCIIAQSAYVTDRDEAMRSGCSDFISKPFKKEELLSVLGKYTRGKIK
jgi:PAS domain S-box-containing protein